ncbi:MAG: hypothetical protein RL684_3156 [Pseudomonadota bacterium]|jgi:GMP synthase (glutamine-hydrolysing)
MTRLLLLEGNPSHVRARAGSLGIRNGSELYASALQAIDPTLQCDVAHAADAGQPLPAGASLRDYQGLVIGGSALHAYSTDLEVSRQLEFLRAVAEVGMPMLGSCWGLQIAAVVAGGEVARNSIGREIGLARKVTPTVAGRSHGLLRGKGDAFDALCIHYDEVTRMPPGGIVLARNSHCDVQAAQFTVGRSLFWGLQYHPEFDLAHQAALFRLYRDDLLSQGFLADDAALDAYLADWDALAADPTDRGLAWQLGIDEDTLDDGRRRGEIGNWLRDCVR